MSLYQHTPKSISRSTREHRRSRSHSKGFRMITNEDDGGMCVRNYLMGYGALVAYLVLTKLFGVEYFELQDQHRPVWIFGAVLMLVLLLIRPWREVRQ